MHAQEAAKQAHTWQDVDDALTQIAGLWQRGALTACMEMALAASQTYPSAGVVWKILGGVYQQSGALALAEQALAEAARLIPEDAEVFLTWANVCAQQDQTTAAISHYRRALALDPSLTLATANLAVCLKETQQSREAEALLKNALIATPNQGRLLFELAALLHETGRSQEALPYYDQALLVEPGNAVLNYNYAQALLQQEAFSQAADYFARAIAIAPDYCEAHWHLGDAYRMQHDFNQAEQAYLQALALDDVHWGATNSLAQLYKQMQLPDAYLACMTRLMQLTPPDADVLNQFAAQLISQHLYADAERFCQQALAASPHNPYVFCNMAVILHHRQAYADAVVMYEKALALQPEMAAIWSNYSVSLRLLGQLSQAHDALARALALDPHYVDAHINLGNLYLDEGSIAQAVATFQHALTLDPQSDKAYRNILYADSYANVLSPEAHLATAQALGQCWMARATPFQAWQLHAQDNRLRIGLVSADLHSHPVAYFLLNWFKHVDAGQIELYAYSTHGKEDSFTAQLKPYCVQWRSLAGLNDARAAQCIQADGIHILLDLSGFTADSRVSLFAWKPAPIQASWLGYWDTTGLPAMDVVITDEVSVPPNLQAQFTEAVAYLPHSRLCFSPPQVAIDVNSLPALSHSGVTFGCFQNYSKVGDGVLALWAQVFNALPNARLYWQCKAFSDPAVQTTALARLAEVGIAASRCQLAGKMPRADYLAAYHQIDCLLDTAPFTGGTTTCEALWMGVPTVTMAGQSMIARQGAALMCAAGLADWVASDEAEYVRLAIAKANQLTALATLRQGLRAQVLASPLMDGALFARQMHTLLWQLWQSYLPRFTSQLQRATPIQHAFATINATKFANKTVSANSTAPVWIISATRMDEAQFWQNAALGRSLLRQQQQDARLHAVVSFNNRRGLSEIFNQAIAEAPDDATLVFVHDDVWLDENPLVAAIHAGLAAYDVIGLAGNKRSVPRQPAWLFADLSFTWEKSDTLLGAVAHGASPFAQATPFGERAGESKLMDGVFLAAKKQTLIAAHVQFDPRFDFHFYDLDFCQTATAAGLHLGVWPIAITHQSDGAFGSPAWRTRYQTYLEKWFPNPATQSTGHAVTLEAAVAEVLALAEAAIARGDHSEAQQCLQEVLKIAPAHASAHTLLQSLHTTQTPPALANPSSQPAQQMEALLALFSNAQYAELQSQLEALLNAQPQWYEGWRMLSDVLLIQKKDASQAAYKALQCNQQDAQAHNYYGLVLKAAGAFHQAAHAFRAALAISPDLASAHNNLGTVLKELGQVDEAIAAFKQALRLNPQDAGCFSNLLFCMAHAPAIDQNALFAAHRAYADLYEAPLKAHWAPHQNMADPAKPLKIGMVSADFRGHSMAHFLLPLLPALAAHPALELIAYANTDLTDHVTQALQPYFQAWHTVTAWSEDALAAQIRQDGIDILIDLSGHTAGNRLLTFARKPAPIQISWLGYLNSTGLSAMDYTFADPYALPAEQFDAQYSEALFTLPVYACFSPAPEAPAVNALPARKQKHITFACFNRLHKINAPTVALWARLMLAVPESQLLLGGMPSADDTAHVNQWFADAGVAISRIRYVPQADMGTYLGYYQQVDICLDTFPVNGVTTTAHALWMGVPTLTIAGERHASRGAMALLQHVGLNNWVASDAEDFVARGIALCADLTALQATRHALRAKLAASPLYQPQALAEALSKAFRQMWVRWCDTQSLTHAEQPTQTALLPTADAIHTEEAALLQQAQAAMDAGDIAAAQARYNAVLALTPNHAFAHHALGLMLAHSAGVAEALSHFEAAVLAAPEEGQYWVTYIDAFILLGDLATASAALQQALQFGLEPELAASIRAEIQQKRSDGQVHAAHHAASQAHPRPAPPAGLPTITTLIPAYKPAFITQTLLALTAQTYPHFQVIVSDDSPNQEITQLLASEACASLRAKLALTVIQGPRQGGMSNIVHLLGQTDDSGLIHVLMDDDLIYPKFYEKHVEAHLQGQVSVSVSYRWFCDQHGQPLGVTPVPEWVSGETQSWQRVNAQQLFGSVFPRCDNWLGEFSNAVFQPAAIRRYARSRLGDIAYYGLGDIGAMLEASLMGDVGLIKDYLGAFRQHATQYSAQQHSKVFQCGVIAWVALALGAYREQQISATVLQQVVQRMARGLSQRYPEDPAIQTLVDAMQHAPADSDAFAVQFNWHWEAFINCQDWQAAHALQSESHHALSSLPA